MPAIDHQHCTVDVTGSFRAKEDCGLFDIRNLTKATEGNSLPQLLLDWFGNQALHPFCIPNRPGSDGVYTNAVASPFDCKISGESVNACLGGRHVNLHRCTKIVERRTDIQNLPTVLFQLREGGCGNMGGALGINVDNGAETVW